MIERLDLHTTHDHHEANLHPFAVEAGSLYLKRANTLRSRWPVVPRDAATRIAAARRFGFGGVVVEHFCNSQQGLSYGLRCLAVAVPKVVSMG